MQKNYYVICERPFSLPTMDSNNIISVRLFFYPKMNYKALLYVHKRLSRLSRELSFNVYNMPSSFIVQSILIRFYHITGNNSIVVYHCYLVTYIIHQTFCTTRIHPYIN